MKNKTITWLILAATAVMIIAVFLPNLLLNECRGMLNTLNSIYQTLEIEEWESANEYMDSLMRDWENQKYILAFNYAEEDYATFQHAVYRLKNYVKNQEKSDAMAEADVAISIFKQNFSRFMPEP